MAPIIQLTRFGQYFAIEPANDSVLEALGRTFYTSRHDLDGARLRRRWHPLLYLVEDSTGQEVLKCGAGLEPLVVEQLRRSGFEVRLDQGGRRRLKRYRTEELQDVFGHPDTALLDAVRQHDRAVITYRKRHVQPARLIAQIALAWPRLSIAVLVTRVAEAEQLKRQLRCWIPNVECYHVGHHPDSRHRVAVFTYAHAGGGEAGLTKRNVVIAYNAVELVRAFWGRMCLEHCWKDRLYGLLPDGLQLSPHDQDQVTAQFGTTIVPIPAHGRQDRPVDVRFTRIEGGPRPPQSAGMLQLLREGIWRHPVRNRRLAAAADAIANGDHGHRATELAAEFDWLDSVEACRVVVLAANLEHALLLARKLPGWSVVCGPDVWTDGLSDRDRRRLQQGEAGWRRNSGLIATPDGLGRVGRVDVLVRADGGAGLPPLDERVATCTDGSQRLLIVDAADRHHPRLRQWTRERRQAYLNAGWSIVGQEPRSELDKFLDTRPAVEMPS